MKLLIEEAYEMDTEIVEEINESNIKEKNYYIQGTFSTPDKKNRNGRIYSMQLWEDNVQKYQEHIKNNTINTLGELEHPSRVSPEPMKAVMKIVELKIDSGLVKGRAKILNNNSPETNQIKSLIDEGIKIGVSSRGTGRMKGEIVEEFSLSCYDLVSQPSDFNANLSGISESIEKMVQLDESTGKYECTENCTIEGTGGGDIAQDCVKEVLEAFKKYTYTEPEISVQEQKAKDMIDHLSESAVGLVGRTGAKDAEDYIAGMGSIKKQLRELLKKAGGKTVILKLLDQMNSKPQNENQDEIIKEDI